MVKKRVLLTVSGLALALMSVLCSCMLLDLFKKSAPEEEVIDIANFTNRSMLLSARRVTEDGLLKTNPVISPDGSRLLYCEEKTVKDSVTGLDVIHSDIVMLRNVNSSAKTPLVSTGNGFTPGWYEDNTRYLFSFHENNTRRIVRSSSAGGGRTNITRNPVGTMDQSPVIKNGIILFCTWEAGNWYLYSMRDNGNDVTRLGIGMDPSWHPTENKFIYVKRTSSNSAFSIWEMDMTTMQETNLYEMPRFNIRKPIFTHNGSHIVFQRGSEQVVTGTQVSTSSTNKQSRQQTANTEVRWQLFSITAEGFNESALTEGNVDCTHPSLDQNDTLFFVSNAAGVRANKTEIYKAQLNFK